MSMISTRAPTAARAVPRVIAVVVLPTPPFWLATARTRGRWHAGRGSSCTLKSPDTDHAPAGVAEGGRQVGVEGPGFPGLLQLAVHTFSLEEKAFCPKFEVGLCITEQPGHRRAGPCGDDLDLQL